jgi:hypothetical protein
VLTQVADDGDDDKFAVLCGRAYTDVDGEFAAVFAASMEILAKTHWAYPRGRVITRTVVGVRVSAAIGDQ